jgi:lipopolysaccharide export LptBFGC system permease protein LptF
LLLERIQHELPELLRCRAGIGASATYFALLLPSLLPLAVPISIFIATLHGLGRLRRDGELIAMGSAGMSLLSMTRFLWLSGFAAALLLHLCTITLIPAADGKMEEFTAAMKARRPSFRRGELLLRNVTYDCRDSGRLWLIGELDLRSGRARSIDIHAYGAEGESLGRIHGQEGSYENGRWRLEGVRQWGTDGCEHFQNLSESPELMQLSQKRLRAIPPRKIKLLLERMPKGDPAAAAYETHYHMANAGCWSCLAALFCAIPFAAAAPAGAAAAASRAMGLLFAFYCMTGICRILGGGGRLPPLAAAWLPNAFVLLLGIYLIRRAR